MVPSISKDLPFLGGFNLTFQPHLEGQKDYHSKTVLYWSYFSGRCILHLAKYAPLV